MDVLKMVKEWTRLCESMTYCECCPVGCYLPDGAGVCPANGTTVNISNIFKAVEKRAAENPPKTILQDLLEKYPDTKLDDQGIPCDICPSNLGFSDNPKCPSPEENICIECWGMSVDDAKEAIK